MSFYQKVYDIVAKIPAGKVATYGQIALILGHPRAAKAVGQAMSRAPEGLPCHRVVNQQGTLAPGNIFGGLEKQRELLLSEGIAFRANGRIDVKKHIWNCYSIENSKSCE